MLLFVCLHVCLFFLVWTKTIAFCVFLLQNIQGMTGTPMVAASPERHDGGIQANPVEVQSYQAPWKVLSDFALQSDIDQPAFQQLVRLLLLLFTVDLHT